MKNDLPLVECNSDEPSDEMMRRIADVLDQSQFTADESI